MILIDTYIKTDLNCETFKAKLYYIKFNSKNIKDMCLLEIDEHMIPVTTSSAYEKYSEIVKKYIDGELDLFILRDVSVGWLVPNYITEKIIGKLKLELK